MLMVKRIVGLPGEEIALDFGDVVIDGRPGIDLWGPAGQTFPEGTWRVGEAEVFVLSDNRKATIDDGRSFGPATTQGMMQMIWPR
jgi:signal peptidase I